MRLERLSNDNKHLYDSAITLYESAFPPEERRNAEEQCRAMEKEAYHFNMIMNSEVCVRPYREGDDKAQIAKLIYQTDPYIYPYWFDSVEDGVKVLSQMIELPTLYNKKNITVAATGDGFIAGIVVSTDTPVIEHEENIVKAFSLAKIKMDGRTHEMFLAYYDKMAKSNEGYYISNVAVDPDYQKRGIATSLMSYIVKDRPLCYLECVQKNIGAWRLYQRLGFSIAQQYPGVFDVPCYKMIRKV